jgi:predicted enzyme involved in methoxymalonyl-ACP biosynthesis
MISVVICRDAGNATWDIDTWLMSCRVLGRKVEFMVLREILRHASEAGIRKLTGTYRATDRNKLVIDHYSKLGFSKIGGNDIESTQWELVVDQANPDGAAMKVVSTGFGAPPARSLQDG